MNPAWCNKSKLLSLITVFQPVAVHLQKKSFAHELWLWRSSIVVCQETCSLASFIDLILSQQVVRVCDPLCGTVVSLQQLLKYNVCQ